MKIKVFLPLLWTLAVWLLPYACQDALDFDVTPSHQPYFSTDTVQLDTVFSTITSSSRRLTLHNPHGQRLAVRVFAAQACQAGFSVLADGVPLTDQPLDLTVEARDSVVLFVSLSAPEQQRDTLVPLLRTLSFVTNGQTKTVAVAAAVQDVLQVKDTLAGVLRWSGRKPYLVWNALRVDSLTIEAGVSVYLHHQAGLEVTQSLDIRGTAEHPVLLAGDRLEHAYRSYPGQWGSLVLAGDATCHCTHTEIRNGTNGLIINKNNTSKTPAEVRLSACRVLNMSYAGIQNASSCLIMDNTVVANCGYVTLQLAGGSCRLFHCTLTSNYNRYMVRHSRPAVCLEPSSDAGSGAVMPRFGFYNTLIYGTFSSEVQLGESLADGDVLFDHCLVRVPKNMADNPCFRDCVLSSKQPFQDAAGEVFAPDSLSQAIGAGSLVTACDWPADLAGNDRTADGMPDVGAYEFQGR